jgi:hypothetical protein
VKFPGEIRQTSGCSSKKFARERAKLKKKKEQTEVLEYWEVARNWDGCVPEISVALVCCVHDYITRLLISYVELFSRSWDKDQSFCRELSITITAINK